MKLLHLLTLVAITPLVMNCSARPIKSAEITDVRPTPYARVIEKREVVESQSEISVSDLRQLNIAAGKPTIAIIKGFYQLPEAFPYDAISYERERGFGFDYKSITISKPSGRPYVVTPASAKEVESLSSSMNHMMNAGVRFKILSLADATKVIRAEKLALSRKRLIFPKTRVMSGVDLLLSVEKGIGISGPVFVGRVIGTKDGQLYALDSQIDAGPYSLGPFISKLVKNGLERMEAAK